MPTYLWIIIIALVLFFWLASTYNALVRWKNRVRESWSDIEVQLKRRYNLIPNLVQTVKGYAVHEKEVFRQVTEARAKAIEAKDPIEKAEAEKGLSGTLKTLFAVAENYPVLRASENFQKLQDELTDTENKVQSARRFYNGNVRDFNTKQEIFPSNLIAKLFNFKKADFFELEGEEEKKAPKVSF